MWRLLRSFLVSPMQERTSYIYPFHCPSAFLVGGYFFVIFQYICLCRIAKCLFYDKIRIDIKSRKDGYKNGSGKRASAGTCVSK